MRATVGATEIGTHLEALQAIADVNGGNRAAGTSGYSASVEYVQLTLEDAGYLVERHPFTAGGVSSVSLIVERVGLDAESVVMLGAHLDSVPAGPGINDNGSGVMSLLALAQRLRAYAPPARTVRFAFWGAEELGRLGSRAYVASLTADERARIVAYLNFDMLGSPNYSRFVYAEAAAAPGSEALTELFGDYFAEIGLSWAPIDLAGDSDHGPFTDVGVPTGGLFSGGIEPKTDAEAAAFGGIAGVPADACSHRGCDTIANISDAALDVMSDAVAHALTTLAAGNGSR